ncbi:MAG: P-loop NTPase family protein, partial [Candidatus Helarchaeales archaeon]
EGQCLRYDMALYVLKGYKVLMFSNPELGLNTTEVKKFFDALKAINEEFQITTFLHSNDETIRNCDRILVIDEKGNQIGFGTLTQLFQAFPLGEFDPIIVVQLNKKRPTLIKDLTQIPGLLLMIEERKNEKFHLFFKEKHEEKLQLIYEKVGNEIFSLETSSPTLFDFLRYTQQKRAMERK